MNRLRAALVIALFMLTACGSQGSDLPENYFIEAIAIAAGNAHSLAVKADGSVWAWGSNEYGQLGTDSTTENTLPIQVMGLPNTIAVAAGNQHSMALASDGSVWAWGRNNMGQLGIGTTDDSSTPVKITGLSDVISVAAGWAHSFALLSNGALLAWGNNSWGQLGTVDTSDNTVPNQTQGIPWVTEIAPGNDHNIALSSDGIAWLWGRNTQGQLGDGTSDIDVHSIPMQLAGFTGVKGVAAGWGHSALLAADGSIWAWGDNDEGQIGDGTTTNSFVPVQTSGLTSMVAIESGYFTMIATTPQNTLKSWGRNTEGELGASSPATFSDVPLDVTFLDEIIDVSCSLRHCLALRTDETIWAWGSNADGQLGDGTNTSYNAPGPVLIHP